MQIDSKIIPDNILKLMSPEDRKSFGKAGLTSVEIADEVEAKSEKKLQDQLQDYLLLRGIVCGRQRMDKKSTMALGWPDLVWSFPRDDDGALPGIPCAWEVKLPGKTPTEEQTDMLLRMKKNGWRVAVITSVAEAKVFLDGLEKTKILEKQE